MDVSGRADARLCAEPGRENGENVEGVAEPATSYEIVVLSGDPARGPDPDPKLDQQVAYDHPPCDGHGEQRHRLGEVGASIPINNPGSVAYSQVRTAVAVGCNSDHGDCGWTIGQSQRWRWHSRGATSPALHNSSMP
jgi:hypothetical protein